LTPEELDEWFRKCHENLKPLDESYYRAAKPGNQFLFGTAAPVSANEDKTTNRGSSSRDISYEEINRRRDEIIEYYERIGQHDKGVELREIAAQWKKIHHEYSDT
jgi:hypothetical protein